MRLNERTLPVRKSATRIERALWDMQEEEGLTDIEMLRILIDAQSLITKYMLRDERHPGNPDHKADEACNSDCNHDDATTAPNPPCPEGCGQPAGDASGAPCGPCGVRIMSEPAPADPEDADPSADQMWR